jgi:pimeloyl-ACP methyl ester carboxylesterase
MSVQALDYGHPRTARDAGMRALLWREYTKPHSTFHVVTQDGIQVRGIHLRAESTRDRNSSTLLIYCHGFLGGKNFLLIQRFAERLADEMDVITFDFRGHGESGGATTLGDKELLDLDAVIQYARNFEYERIVLMGSSMGGAVSIRYAAESPDIGAVITLGAFAHKRFSLIAMAGLGLLRWSVSRRVVRHTYMTRIERALPPYNPRDFVSRIHPRPLLLLHGEYDPLIPLAHARELYANAQDPKTLLVIQRGGHDLENLNQTTRQFILEWLG